MAKKNSVKREPKETDSAFFLKLVLYVILGSLWLKFSEPLYITENFQLMGLPIGLVIGLLFASHDRFQIDRKLEYAILVIMTIVSLFLPIGIIL